MPLFSFIMPVKDEDKYISTAIEALQKQACTDWELVVVNDHSEDGTAGIVESLKGKDNRIALINNKGHGQVAALNSGAAHTNGLFIKMIDGDDVLSENFSQTVDIITSTDASYHDAFIVDSHLRKPNRLRVTATFSEMDFLVAIRNIMISPPRWSWTISKKAASVLFPLPAKLPTPHEDIFIGLKIKKNFPIVYIPKPLYLYRQHKSQFYGGIYNYGPEKVIKRAKAMIGIIDLLKNDPLMLGTDIETIIAPAEKYFKMMAAEKMSWLKILNSKLSIYEKGKLFLIKETPHFASLISRWRSRF